METGSNSGEITGNASLIPQPHGGAIAPPFPKGISPNPGGRPKVGRSVSSAYAELLDTPGDTPQAQIEEFRRRRGDRFVASDSIAIGMLTSAVNPSNRGQTAAAGEITDRTEGKVPNTTALIGADGGPLRVEWVNDWRNSGGEG